MKLLSLTPFVLSLALLAPATSPAAGVARGGKAHTPVKWQRGGHASTSVAPAQERLMGAIRLAIAKANQMNYSQSGSRAFLPLAPGAVPPATDCSGFATWALRSAGANVPLSTSYTFLSEGRSVALSTSALVPGDVIVYSGHVAVYIGGGMTAGHGRAGVQLHPWNYRPVIGARRLLA